MNEPITAQWGVNWMWGLLIIVVTVLFHTFCLALLNRRVTRVDVDNHRLPELGAMGAMGIAVLSVTLLHGAEAIIWAATYRLLGALSENKMAVLYSLSAMTTYGHANLYLAPQWQLMGALEALNGMILFGLTTAFLFTVLQRSFLNATHA